jgi:LysR family glycine cleavage system transcriptional activator
MLEFAEVVQRSLKDISVAVDNVKRQKTQGNLTISVPPGLAERWLMPRLGDFYESYPDVTIALDKNLKFATFRNDGIDAAIRFGDGTFEELQSDYLFAWRKWAVASPGYIAEHGKLDDLAHPKQHRLIDCRYASKDLAAMCGRWEDVVASDYTDPKQQLIILPDDYQALTAAIHGRGIALLPSLLLEDDIEAGNIVYANNQSVSVPGGYYYVSPTAARPNSVLDAFRDWLVERTVKLRSEDDSP